MSDEIKKVILLDFDGPLLPARAYFLPENTIKPWDRFDPIAIALVLRLLNDSGAKIVLSTSWANSGPTRAVEALERNGIGKEYLHPTELITPKKMTSQRAHEVYWWLDKHPEITHWVTFDDLPDIFDNPDSDHSYGNLIAKGKWIQVTFDNGIEMEHYNQARVALGLKKQLIIG